MGCRRGYSHTGGEVLRDGGDRAGRAVIGERRGCVVSVVFQLIGIRVQKLEGPV